MIGGGVPLVKHGMTAPLPMTASMYGQPVRGSTPEEEDVEESKPVTESGRPRNKS